MKGKIFMAKSKNNLQYEEEEYCEELNEDYGCSKKDIQRILGNQRKRNRDRRNNKNKRLNNIPY
jgi:hypothetical protein